MLRIYLPEFKAPDPTIQVLKVLLVIKEQTKENKAAESNR